MRPSTGRERDLEPDRQRVEVLRAREPGDRLHRDRRRLPHVTVADAGIGIPSRDLERIFERFYRVDQARSRATGGTGLGLAIVRHVAQAHGGEVTVESVEGQGSVFRLLLPVEADDTAPAPVPTAPQETA